MMEADVVVIGCMELVCTGEGARVPRNVQKVVLV